MKRFYIFPLLCLLLLGACDNSSEDVDVADELRVDISQEVVLTKEAATYEIWFETNCDWEASIKAVGGGMTIDTTAGRRGTNKVVLTAEENPMYDSRSATVTISTATLSYDVEFTQAAGVDIMEVDIEEIYFEAEGGSATVKVTNNLTYEFEVTDTTADWLTLPVTKAYGIDELTLVAEANDGSELRSTTVYVNGTSDLGNTYQDSIMVYQKPSIVLSVSECNFRDIPAEGETLYVTCEPGAYDTYTVNSNEWVTSTMISGGDSGVDTISFRVAANATGSERVSTVKITGIIRDYEVDSEGNVTILSATTVYQDVAFSQIDNKILSATSLYYTSQGGGADTLKFNFISNVEYEAIVLGEWASVGEEIAYVNSYDKQIPIYLEANDPEEDRNIVVRFKSVADSELYFDLYISQDKAFLLEGVTAFDDIECDILGDTVKLVVSYNDSPDDQYYDVSWITSLGVSTEGLEDFQYQYTFKIDPFVPSDANPYSRETDIYFARASSSTDSVQYRVFQSYAVENSAPTSGNNLDGVLAAKYGADYKSTMPSLKIVGSINLDELQMVTEMTNLTRLDLSDAEIIGNVYIGPQTIVSVDEDGNETVTVEDVYVENNAIPAEQFKGNTILQEVLLPNTLTTIGNSAFEDCTGFKGDLVITNKVTTICEGAFRNSTYDGSLTFPTGLLTIGEEAFYGCSNFTGQLYMYNKVVTIGDRAFYGCSGFNGVLKLPRSLETIQESVFENCTSLQSGLVIPSSVIEIEKNAFKNCSGMAGTITLEAPLAIIRESAFENCSGLTGDLDLPNTLVTLEKSAFKNCRALTGLTLPESLTSIEEYTFANCRSLATTVSIPSSITTVGDYAFYFCSSMSGALSLHTSLVSIGDYAFYGCSAMTGSLTISTSIESIGKYAFAYCTKSTGTITLYPTKSSLVVLEEGVFYYSGYKNSLALYSPMTTVKANAISNTNQTGTINFTSSISVIEKQDLLVATALKFNWTEASQIPADLRENLLAALDPLFLLETVSETELTEGTYVIYIPVGATSVYATVLEGYRFEESEELGSM